MELRSWSEWSAAGAGVAWETVPSSGKIFVYPSWDCADDSGWEFTNPTFTSKSKAAESVRELFVKIPFLSSHQELRNPVSGPFPGGSEHRRNPMRGPILWVIGGICPILLRGKKNLATYLTQKIIRFGFPKHSIWSSKTQDLIHRIWIKSSPIIIQDLI